MKKLKLILIASILTLGLNSCRTMSSVYNIMDFKPMETSEAEPHTVTLRNSAVMEFSGHSSPLPLFRQWDTNVFGDWEKGKDYKTASIPAGTKVKILAVVHTNQMVYYPFLLAEHTRYLVETPDGKRGTAFIPEAVEGLKVGFHNMPDTTMTISRVRIERINQGKGMKFWFKMKEDGKEYTMKEADLRVRGQLPVYHDGEMVILKKKDLDSLEGKTLAEVESIIAPTYNISKEGGKLVAKFPFALYAEGDIAYSGVAVPLIRKDGKLVADSYKFMKEENMNELSKIVKLIYGFEKISYQTSIRSASTGFGYYSYPRISFISSHLMSPMVRTIVGILLGIILFFVTFIFIVPLLARLVFYIKPLSNQQVKKISGFIFIIIYIGFIVYFNLYTSILALIISIIIAKQAYEFLYTYIDLRRCSVCHAVGMVKFTESIIHSDRTDLDPNVYLRTTTYSSGKRVTGRTYWLFRVLKRTRIWSDNYVCTKCGHRHSTIGTTVTSEEKGKYFSDWN